MYLKKQREWTRGKNIEPDYKFSRKCRLKRSSDGVYSVQCAHQPLQLFYITQDKSLLQYSISLRCIVWLNRNRAPSFISKWKYPQKWIHNFSSICQTLCLFLLFLSALVKRTYNITWIVKWYNSGILKWIPCKRERERQFSFRHNCKMGSKGNRLPKTWIYYSCHIVH